MKKNLLLFLIGLTCILCESNAQFSATITRASDEELMEYLKNSDKPELMKRAKLSDAQVEKVFSIQIWAGKQLYEMSVLQKDTTMGGLNKLNDEKVKKYQAIPLTNTQIKEIVNHYEEKRKRPISGIRESN
jgi:hypothetical protein